MPQIRADASARIDEYFSKASPFAQPICKRLRAVIHKADPGIVEDWKWGPNFNKAGMVCGIGAFANHVTLTFFQGALLKDPKKILIHGAANARNRSVKFTSADEIDERTLIAYLKEAVRNNERGLKARPTPQTLRSPADFRKALSQKPIARAFFDGLAHTHRKEVIVWITSAKKPETRTRRIAEAVTMLTRRQKTR